MTLTESEIKVKDVVLNWHQQLAGLSDANRRAAQAKADLEYHRARSIVELIAEDPKMSNARADSIVDAMEKTHDLNLEYRLAEAELDSIKKNLEWYRSASDTLRTLIASEREQNKLASNYVGS